jgi:hypothetical protein
LIWYKISAISIPFIWIAGNNVILDRYVKEDGDYLNGYENRDKYNWPLLIGELLKNMKVTELKEIFNINPRSVRKWREGKRFPRYRFIPKLFKLLRENEL